MRLLLVEAPDALPLLASVVWGTLKPDDGSDPFIPVEERLWTEDENSPTLQ
jgi:hypothetical protein